MYDDAIMKKTVDEGIARLIYVNKDRKAGDLALYDSGKESSAIIISCDENRLLVYVKNSKDEYIIDSIEKGSINTIKMNKDEMRMFLFSTYVDDISIS